MASPSEIKDLVEKEGSFATNHLQISDKSWTVWKTKKTGDTASEFEEMEGHGSGHDIAMGVRAVIESTVGDHFGKEILNDVFTRYEKVLMGRKPIKEMELMTSLTVSLTRKMSS